ncbi:MAG: hypothetical protein ACXVD1_04350 [Nocardioides sp.]
MSEEQQPFPDEDDRPIEPEPPGEFPDDPDYAGEEERPVPEPDEEYDAGGQVSEVQNLDPANVGEPVGAGDSVTGAGGGSASDAVPAENRRDNEMKAADRHRLGESVEDL